MHRMLPISALVLPFSYPVHDFGFALAQSVVFAHRLGGGKAVDVRRGCGKGATRRKRSVKIGQQDFHGAERGIVESVLRTENHVKAIMTARACR